MRMIDASRLIFEIKHCLWDWESVNGITARTVLKQTLTDIENQPFIDIVRCKECKHYHVDMFAFCDIDNRPNSENWYCASGERK